MTREEKIAAAAARDPNTIEGIEREIKWLRRVIWKRRLKRWVAPLLYPWHRWTGRIVRVYNMDDDLRRVYVFLRDEDVGNIRSGDYVRLERRGYTNEEFD